MEFSVLQWNVSYLEPIAGIAQTIKAIGADVVCLQELTLNYQPDHLDTGRYLAELLGYHSHYKYAVMPLPDGSSGALGNGIFSRFSLAGQKSYDLQAGTALNYPRYYLEASLNLDGQSLTIGTTHLPFRPSFRTTKFKKTMTDQLLTKVDPQAKNLILTGDLNSTPDSLVVKTLSQHLKPTGPGRQVKTWTKQPFAIAEHHYDQLNWRIDHVFYKGQLKVVSSQVIETNYSDHRPLLINFRLADLSK